jgi:regulator of RNase E activity RraA
MPGSIPREEMIARYERVYTGAISDILDELGVEARALPHTIQALVPGQRVIGVAMPVYGEATASSDPKVVYVPLLKMLGSLQPGQVIVNQANDTVSAHLGELSSETAKYRGCRGAVIHGGVRDVDYILKLDFPVFACYTTPLDVMGRWRVVDFDVPIQIGEVAIHPGDMVVGDRDGVIVVPGELSEEVLLKAEDVVSTENLIRRAVLEGVHPLDAYYQHGRF